MSTSTPPLIVGLQQTGLIVRLQTDGDFDYVLYLVDGGSWPVGTTLTLEFTPPDDTPIIWTATIAGTDAAWHVDKADADDVPDKCPAKLRYVNGTTDQIWAIGKAHRD